MGTLGPSAGAVPTTGSSCPTQAVTGTPTHLGVLSQARPCREMGLRPGGTNLEQGLWGPLGRVAAPLAGPSCCGVLCTFSASPPPRWVHRAGAHRHPWVGGTQPCLPALWEPGTPGLLSSEPGVPTVLPKASQPYLCHLVPQG